LPVPLAGPSASKEGELNFGELDLPLLSPEPPSLSAPIRNASAAPTSGAPAKFSSAPPFVLGSDPPDEITDEDWVSLDSGKPPPVPIPPAPALEAKGAVTRQGGGGTAFGELSLGDDDLEVASLGSVPSLGEPSHPPAPPAPLAPSAPPARSAPPPFEDDMEFGGIPQASERSSAVPKLAPVPSPVKVSRPPSRRPSAAPAKKPSYKGRIIAGLVALLVIGGASLEVLTPFGAFGRHVLLDWLNADKFAAEQAGAIDAARRLLASDTFPDAKRAIDLVDAAQAKSPRVGGLLAYGAFVGYYAELRYGRGPNIDAHAKQELAQIPPEKSPAYAELSRAAQAAVESQLPRAKQVLESLAQRDKQDVDVAMLAGEVELLLKDAQKALDDFSRAASLDGGAPRSAFGIARANAALGNDAAAVAQAKKVLTASPKHVGARLLIARSLWAQSRDEAGATSILSEIMAPGPTRDSASPVELVDALAAIARVHMARSRMTQAEHALDEALKIDPKAGPALAGMGEVLYRQGRFTDALARFEAGIQADPEGSAAKIGAAKTKIALERLQEAKEQLKKLRDARPSDFEAAIWFGRVEDALGDKAAAERSYGEAISIGGKQAETIEAYAALAQLLASEGRPADAQAKLAEARKVLPTSAALYRALGDVDLWAGRYEEARDEYQAALKADADDLAARFNLGVTYRHMGKFAEAQGELEKVASLDKEYPGLALERGLLYESSNRTKEALEFYQQALAKAPDDPDLMLRVGSAEVVSGQASQAEEILRKVVSKRPNSAEVNHYLGRALLLKGTNLAEALRYLKRAVDIDANRAEYHLYVGWAANEAGQPAVAQEELAKALELDKGLADAYWQLGVMLRKQGAVIDAMKNLQKALELRPTRFEAYATLAECLEDENKPADAIAAWRKAIASDGSRAEWHYRLGKLLGRAGESELQKAVALCESSETRPGWLAQAYFELAEGERSSGRAADAIQHYKRFLALAKVDSPYRNEALRDLKSLGATYDGPP
jgi:tetratricopeptide (TPR) repeat protein